MLVKIICLAILVSSHDAFGTTTRSLSRRSVNNNVSTAISSLSNQQIDVSLSLEVDSPWENFIIPGPAVISLLGQLMVISGKVDFSLVENAPVNGFKYVRHPNSFRATLVQVSNDGWGAFMNAHKNMDKIQLYMQQIPSHVKTALKVILDASPALVKRLLPMTLEQIQDIGQQCVQLSAETETKFNDVMLLLGEILEATESSRGTYDAKYFAAQVELNASAVQKQQLENIGANLRKRQADIDVQVKKYQDAYEKALKEIPTGWKAIAQDIVRAVVNVVNVATLNFLNKDGSSGAYAGSSGQNLTNDFQTANLMGIMGQFGDQVSKLKDGITKVFSNAVGGGAQNPAGMFQGFTIGFNTIENLLANVASQTGQNSIQLIQRAKRLCSKMQNMFKNVLNVNISDEEKAEVMQEVDSLYESVQPIAAAGAYASNGMTMQSTNQAVPPSTFQGKYGNERFKAYMNLELLRDSQTRSDKIFEDMLKYQEEMKKLMTRMATLDLESINFRDIIELIKEGIIILAKIREQWSKLIQFFAMISVRAEVALNQTLTPFIRMSEEAQGMIGSSGLTDQDRQFFKEILQKQAVDIHKVAFFLYTLSKTYVDVSSRFLMDRLAGLARMLVTSDDAQRQTMLRELETENNVSQNEIKRIAHEKRVSYKRLLQQRIDDVNNYVQQLGGPSAKDQEAARKGIDAIKTKESNPNRPFDLDSFIYNT